MFELHQLEQLIAVAECGTLSQAAEKLHISQPALSRSIQKLESELQAELFLRSKNKIELNDNGKLAVECARKVVGQAEDMVEQVRSYDRNQRTIFIGSCAPAPLWELSPCPFFSLSGQSHFHRNERTRSAAAGADAQ